MWKFVFQYPRCGSIGCRLRPAAAAYNARAFQYPRCGSIGCRLVERYNRMVMGGSFSTLGAGR